jgi:hypothetical protein
VLGLFAYNIGAAILFAWLAVAKTLRGFMLLPAVHLHVVVAGALLQSFWSGGQFALGGRRGGDYSVCSFNASSVETAE